MTSNRSRYIIVLKLSEKDTFISRNLSHFQPTGGIFSKGGYIMDKLRGYRVMLGLTQKDMSDKLNISLQSYNNKETGKSAFNDKERLAIKSMVSEIKPDITIDELFYS